MREGEKKKLWPEKFETLRLKGTKVLSPDKTSKTKKIKSEHQLISPAFDHIIFKNKGIFFIIAIQVKLLAFFFK